MGALADACTMCSPKKDRLQEVHVCGGEAGQQMLLVQEAASAQLTCLCGLTIKKVLCNGDFRKKYPGGKCISHQVFGQ